MPRPRKQKMICALPSCNAFAPCGKAYTDGDMILMSIEEYETIRLIDYHNMDQTQCAEEMGVARSTVQRLYTDARRKIAGCIVDGQPLKISGGDYTLCTKREDPSKCEGCPRHRGRHGIDF